jgi:hypothetical protein
MAIQPNTNPTFLTDANIAGVLKNVYARFRINAFPILTPLLANVKKGRPGGPENMRFGGNGVFWDVALSRPVGDSSSQAGNLPVSYNAIEQQAQLGIKRTYVRRQIDALAILATQSREAAFVPLVRKLIQEAVDAGRLAQQRILNGDGNGIRATVNTITSNTVYTVSQPYGITGAGEGGLLLDVGMYVSVLNSASPTTVRFTDLITGVTNNGDIATITFQTGGTGVVAGDFIVGATAADNSYGNEPNGLTNIVNRGNSYPTFENISGGPAGTYPRWDAVRLAAGTDSFDPTAPTELDVWKLATRIQGKSGKNAKVAPAEFLYLTTPGMELQLASSFLGQRRFAPEDYAEIKGGFKAVSISGIPLVSDYWCPAGTMYLNHLPSLTWVDLLDWGELRYENSGPWRFVVNQDAYEVNFGTYWNFGGLSRNAHGIFTGYSDTTRFSHVM